MRRHWVCALAVLTLLGALAPPVFAQAPAPKVTISGLLDLSSTWSSNLQDTDSTRKETEWYSRERGRVDFIGEVGKAKMVWGIELDFVNGNTPTAHAGTSAGFDLDTDVAGVVETKWLYLQFPFTGKDSLLPFIDVPTVATGGAQPFVGHDYKFGIVASGDFAGLTLVTTVTPQIKNTFTFAQIDECNFRGNNDVFTGATNTCPGTNRDSYALLDSVEVAVTKELTVKPTISYANFGGRNSGSTSLGVVNRGGFDHGDTRNTWRLTAGGDARWTMGPWSLEPTFHYQFGEVHLRGSDLARTGAPNPSEDARINAWIVDAIGGWRSGPLALELRFVYTTGNNADECVTRIDTGNGNACPSGGGDDINYYQSINTGFAYFTGWSEILTSGTEYNNCFMCGAPMIQRRTGIGYDKYGLVSVAARGTYAVTPAVSLRGIVSPSWTAEKVDTNGLFSTTTGITSFDGKGDEDYLGTEIVAGLTWKFAPNLTFDGVYAHLFTGDAYNQCRTASPSPTGGCTTKGSLNTQIRDAKDVDQLTARVRYTF